MNKKIIISGIITLAVGLNLIAQACIKTNNLESKIFYKFPSGFVISYSTLLVVPLQAIWILALLYIYLTEVFIKQNKKQKIYALIMGVLLLVLAYYMYKLSVAGL